MKSLQNHYWNLILLEFGILYRFIIILVKFSVSLYITSLMLHKSLYGKQESTQDSTMVDEN